jgi:hypothetical protein
MSGSPRREHIQASAAGSDLMTASTRAGITDGRIVGGEKLSKIPAHRNFPII